MTLEAGTRVGKYEIQSLVGEGGMGRVYRALDTELGRPVALKFLPEEFAADPRRMSRFEQEARAVSALNHPNILTVYEFGRADSSRFFATEFVDGVTLREHAAARRLGLSEVLDIGVQVAGALAAAHAEGVVHRDVKPENVMVRRDGYVKVLDFGLAKLAERAPARVDTEAATRPLVNTDPGVVMGTVAYMSPEQARGLETDARTDIWSLGVVLYELLTGRPPFAGATTTDTILAVVGSEPAPLRALAPEAPEALEWIVTKALTKEKEERYQTAREMLTDLRRLRRRLDAGAEIERSFAPHLSDAPPPQAARTTEAAKASTVPSARHVTGQAKRSKLAFTLALVAALALVAGLGFVLYKFSGREQSAQPGAPARVTPLTSSPGIERSVAFSPDGKQIAYAWTGDNKDNFDIYVKIIGAGEPLRLTTNPAREMSPAWSPDGRYIAFMRGLRHDSDKGFYLVPALGGAERRLSEAYGHSGAGIRAQALDWSPDGRTLAVVDKTSDDEPWGVFLLSVETGERRRLTQPPAGYNGDVLVAFSPDGSRLAFARTHDLAGDIYLVPVAGGEPARLTADEAYLYGLAWTPDGAGLVFSSERGGGSPTLWRVPAAGGTPAPVAGVTENVGDVSVSRQGNRLAYAQMSADANIYRVEVTGQKSGRLGAGEPVSFISSTRVEQSPRFSPDGRRVVFVSNRSGGEEVWVCDAEGKSPAQLTDFGAGRVRWPSWSPDGRSVAFVSVAGGNADIYVVSADGGSPRRLTTEASREESPSWSRDGRWLYFSSNRSGRLEVWKMPPGGGAAVQVTRGGGVFPVESPDGHTVYYVKRLNESGLWQVSAEGGGEAPVAEASVTQNNWAVAGRGIYFFTSQPFPQIRYTLHFFDFATRRTTPVTTFEGPRGAFSIFDLTVSPDERRILYTQRDKLDLDLMLVENFR